MSTGNAKAKGPGFARGVRYTPLPIPLLGPWLEQVDSLAELKCTLRVVGLVHQRRGQRLWVAQEELLTDPVLLRGLAGQPGGARDAILQGLRSAAARGILMEARRKDGEVALLVNDEAGRRALAGLEAAAGPTTVAEGPSPGQDLAERPNIFRLYEENIGPLTPLLAQELEEAENAYPPSWVEEAFREAVARNRRSWRYIQRILERWTSQGKEHGEPGRHSEETDRQEYLRRYGHLAPRGDH